MSPTAQAILTSWAIDPKLAVGLLLTAFLYLRGWRIVHRVTPSRFPRWRLFSFLAGLATLWFAIASPLDAFSGLLLSAHMVQHLMLMSVAPPLILLGSPLIPLLRGLPRRFAHDGIGPFLSWTWLQRVGHRLTHPLVGWLAMTVSLIAWHLPPAFELALRSPGWHRFEHACFFGAALLFWWPVVRPFPNRPHWPLWTMPVYLLAADLVNTALCAVLAFSEHSIYPTYGTVPRLFGTTALTDQVAAAVIMWVPGSLIFLVPGALLAIQYLAPTRRQVRPNYAVRGPVPTAGRRGVPPVVSITRRRFDLLRVPHLGTFLRSIHGRRTMQTVMLLLAVLVALDGFLGPQISSVNLAGVWPWTYWRAMTVVALLAAGNLFCMACPFMLPRELGRRLGLNSRRWPKALRSKWLAVGLLVLFFWGYEAFALWNKPAWTAWIIVGYFLGAFVVDAFFRGASFCKYVCPIGQFHFVLSTVSPLEVKVREPEICAGCQTQDCLRGNAEQRGCETDLFLPSKSGSLDCTFCLDCVRACPHDNIGLLAVTPGGDVLRDAPRASLGRLARRTDVAFLVLVLVAAAFLSAAAMTEPALVWRDALTASLGTAGSGIGTLIFFGAALLLIPPLTVGAAVALGDAAGGASAPKREMMARLSHALVPLGAAMWAAHFLFHLLAGYAAGWPVLQQAVTATGHAWLGFPDWRLAAWRMDPDSILGLQCILLGAGFLLSLFLGWRIARQSSPRPAMALRLVMPWALVAAVLYAAGIWIFLQPMQMRGLTPG